MSFEAWTVFAVFWVLFVTTPGPNAVNCINNGMNLGMRRAMVGVAGILTQAALFLTLSALGITALITASIIGARTPVRVEERPAKSVYLRAFAIATINPKSVAGYLAAFSQFVQPDVPIWDQMIVIFPTALTLTALSYTGFTALGAGIGRAALGAVFNVWVRRIMGACFILYGIALGTAVTPQRAL